MAAGLLTHSEADQLGHISILEDFLDGDIRHGHSEDNDCVVSHFAHTMQLYLQ
jgi:hypothetical protein